MGGVSEISDFLESARRRAQDIIRVNFLGIGAASELFGVAPSRCDLRAFADVPFPDKTLAICVHSHVLVADFGTSINEMFRVQPHAFSHGDPLWWKSEKFANKCEKPVWRLVRKVRLEVLSPAMQKQQQMVLAPQDEYPSARAAVYAAVGHLLVARECLDRILSSDTTSRERRRVAVLCDKNGVTIYHH